MDCVGVVDTYMKYYKYYIMCTEKGIILSLSIVCFCELYIKFSVWGLLLGNYRDLSKRGILGNNFLVVGCPECYVCRFVRCGWVSMSWPLLIV